MSTPPPRDYATLIADDMQCLDVSEAAIAAEAGAALRCLRRFGAEDLAEMLGVAS